MIEDFKTLYAHRELLWIWTLRNIKLRYKQSFLGGAWAILQPLSLMVVFSIIFTYFVSIPTGDIPYPIFSYTALLPWVFFATSIGFATSSLVNNMNLVTKIYFPREILPIAAVAASFMDLLVAALVFVAMMVFYQIPLHPTMLLVPVLLVVQIFLTLGIVLWAAAVNVFFRDVQFVVPLGVQLWMYATPIIYPVSAVPEGLRGIYMLNPMAGLIESYRAVMLQGVWPDWRYLGLTIVVSGSVFALGYLYFKRIEWQFADII